MNKKDLGALCCSGSQESLGLTLEIGRRSIIRLDVLPNTRSPHPRPKASLSWRLYSNQRIEVGSRYSHHLLAPVANQRAGGARASKGRKDQPFSPCAQGERDLSQRELGSRKAWLPKSRFQTQARATSSLRLALDSPSPCSVRWSRLHSARVH